MPAGVIEIFSSIQGEGIYVGVRQIFLRLAGCNLSCRYCDTPVDNPAECSVEFVPGSGLFHNFANPLTTEIIMDIIIKLEPLKQHSISLTGGEPLLSVSFLKELLPVLKASGLRIYLETNGTLPEQLKEVITLLDFISMDFKLPGATFCGDYWDRHREFLDVARQKNVFVKTVITANTTDDEIRQSAGLIKDIDPAIPLVLQPVTPGANNVAAPGARRVIEIQNLALEHINEVRVIPQTHKYLGQL